MSDEIPVYNYSSKDLLEKYDPEGRFAEYIGLLEEENSRVNLVSRETMAAGVTPLIVESLVPLEILKVKPGSVYLDIGSGGGIPSIPLMLALAMVKAPLEKVALVERTQKKAAALKRICGAMGLKPKIHAETLQDLKNLPQFDLITMRYVKLTPAILKSVFRHLCEGGRFVYFSRPEETIKDRIPSCQVIAFTVDSQPPERYLSLIGKKQGDIISF